MLSEILITVITETRFGKISLFYPQIDLTLSLIPILSLHKKITV
jgi:hypothetical protein